MGNTPSFRIPLRLVATFNLGNKYITGRGHSPIILGNVSQVRKEGIMSGKTVFHDDGIEFAPPDSP